MGLAAGGSHTPFTLSAPRPMSDTPDWSQVATKDDLSQLESRLTQSMSRLEQHIDRISDRLVWWLVGISLTFLVLLGGMVTLIVKLQGLA